MGVRTETVVVELSCERCGHRWKPRYDRLPKVCPECKRTTWNEHWTTVTGEEPANEGMD